jgi:hypothetical protein
MVKFAHKVVAEVVFVKVTVPVGVAVPAVKPGVTVAVKDTCWLVADGLGDETTFVVVLAAVTTCVTVAGVPDEKF